MATGAYLLSPKKSDAAVLTASDSVGGSGASNLQVARPHLTWRSTTITPYVVGDFGSAVAADSLFIGFVNAQASDTFRLRRASTVAKLTDGTAEYDSGALSLWPSGSNLAAYNKIHRSFELPTATLRYYRVDFDFTSNTNGYVEASRLILGARVEPATTMQKGWASGGSEVVAETVDFGGEESPRSQGVKRTYTLVWHDLTFAEAAALTEMMNERGSAKDFALVAYPGNTTYPMMTTYLGRAKEAFSFPQTFKGGSTDTSHHFSYSLTIQEMAPISMA